MGVTPRALVVMTFAAALVVFAVVQDRLTASGAREYVRLHLEPGAKRAAPPTVDQIMGPAVDRSVRQGTLWGGGVLAAGLGLAEARRRRTAAARRRS